MEFLIGLVVGLFFGFVGGGAFAYHKYVQAPEWERIEREREARARGRRGVTPGPLLSTSTRLFAAEVWDDEPTRLVRPAVTSYGWPSA